VCLRCTRPEKPLPQRALSFTEERHGETGHSPTCWDYCGGSWMLSSWTSKMSVEFGGMLPSGVPFSP
jgi:hypothetical protein